jgi:porphobilinogen synthase
MPGVDHVPLDRVVDVVGRWSAMGIGAVLVFGVPSQKTADAAHAVSEGGIVQQAVRAIKGAFPDMYVITDTCVCSYTDHGHCGVIHEGHGDVRLDHDASRAMHAAVAVAQARAGADCVAPSSMVDGVVAEIRHALDGHGVGHVPILSYAVKYASAMYGPFRDAAHAAPQAGSNRSTYQMDCANAREAVREAQADIAQGADWLIVKPAALYLDVIRTLRERVPHPIAAYHVSGEYSMIKAASERGWVHERDVVMETMIALRRAGADAIITYYAPHIAAWLHNP